MKKIGLIGGMSWESTTLYYRLINEMVKEKRGGFHSAECFMYSVDFGNIVPLMKSGDWDKVGFILVEAAKLVEQSGADFLVLCTNTMHKFARIISENINIEFLHIADATGERIKRQNIDRIGLIGTRTTMEESFYKNRLVDNFEIEVITPLPEEMEFIDGVIFNELCMGIIKQDSGKKYIDIMNRLFEKGAQGVILGCTEIGLLVNEQDFVFPIFDTTKIHVEAAVEMALNQ